MRYLLVLFLLASAICRVPLQAQSSASSNLRCSVSAAVPSEADLLLSKEDLKGAESAYQNMLAKSSTDEDARLGIVRVKIGQNKIEDAKSEAASFIHAQPTSGTAEVAAAEADYRNGNIESSFKHANRALQLAPCDGRSSLVLANLYDLTGLHGSAARWYAQAHRLRPEDQRITHSWIASLPAQERLMELDKFLRSKPALSDEDNRGLHIEKEYLEARKPGECRASSTNENVETALSPVYGDHSHPVAYGLDVFLNGKRRRMQIDTGASGIVLSESAARGLQLNQEYHIKSGGLGDEGDRDSYLSHVRSIKIGTVELQNCMVEVIKKSGLDVDGLIGMDVFRKWLVTLDYQAARMRLAPLPPNPATQAKPPAEASGVESEDDTVPQNSYIAPGMQNWLRIARIGHNILLPAVLKPNGPLHYMIMDTGASQSIFSLRLGKEAGKLHSSSMAFQGISGKTRTVYETDLTDLYVGRFHLERSSYYAVDTTNLSHHMSFEVGGLLGLPTLQRLAIEIDYRDNLLRLTYDPKNDQIKF